MYRPLKSIAFLLLITSFSSQAVLAQKTKSRITSISRSDAAHINQKARETLEAFTIHLNALADPNTLDNDEIKKAIDRQFAPPENIFFDETFRVEDDTDPGATKAAPGVAKVNIKAYLSSFRYRFKPKEANSVTHEISDIQGIFKGEYNPYLLVYYKQTFSGKSPEGKKFPVTQKVANMVVLLIGNQYHTYISGIDFAGGASISKAEPLTITDDPNSVPEVGPAQMSEGYYSKMLEKGAVALQNDIYTDAYYDLQEARSGKRQEDDAGKLLLRLRSKMIDRNIDYSEYLFKELLEKAKAAEEKYYYDKAIRYYNHAKEVKPSGSSSIEGNLNQVIQKQENDQIPWDLFNKGAYSDAINSFDAAIKKKNNNPELYIGLARSYQQSGNAAKARVAFDKAIKTDPGYAETYKWQGYFYKQVKDYSPAYQAFANYQAKAEDGADREVQSELAYCKGMLLLTNRNPSTALDSFNAARTSNPSNIQALLELARLYYRQSDLKKARVLIDEALEKDNKNAEAYNLKGQILEAASKKNEAIEAYKTATTYEKNNAKYYYDLGKLQMDIKDEGYNTAILTFGACINASPAVPPIQGLAYWKRGKCYYLQNKIDNAESDYAVYKRYSEEKSAMLSDAFYVDYANLLIKKKAYDEARLYLKKAKETPAILLSFGVLTYMQNPSQREAYKEYFERALRDGVSEDDVENAPNVVMIYDDKESRFRSLLNKYKFKYRPGS